MTLHITRALLGVAALAVSAWTAGAGAQTADPVGRARQLALHGEFREATSLLQRVLAAEPRNGDAVVMLTYVELWSGRAATAERSAAAALATDPDNVDLLVARALSLRQLNREPDAFELLQRARSLAPGRADVRDLYELVRFDVTGSEVAMTADNQTWSDGRGTWREGRFQARYNTPEGTGVLLASRARRAALTDDQLSLELYPRLPIGYVFVGGTYATSARLYARSTFGGELFATPPRLEASGGYQRMNFTSPVNVFTGSGGVYDRAYFFDLRLTGVTGETTGISAALAARRYSGDGAQYVELSLGGGSVAENIQTQTDVVVRASMLVAADALVLVDRRWVLTPRLELERDLQRTSTLMRTRIALGVGRRF